jgi:hypothetical protein
MASYERQRARNAYHKQIGYFKMELKAEIRLHVTIDFNAKMQIKFKAMGLKRECLDNYRNDLKGIEYDTRMHEFTDIWKQHTYSPYKTKNVHVLEYELQLTEGIDAVINNIDLLTNENKEKLIYFNEFSCYKATFS